MKIVSLSVSETLSAEKMDFDQRTTAKTAIFECGETI